MNTLELFTDILNVVVFCINIIGISIIMWGVTVAARNFTLMKLRKPDSGVFLADANQIRSLLGTYILFGLEFMIAGDLMHTIIKPTQQELIVLATIVAIRTVISYFLGREIEEERSQLNNRPLA